MKRTKFQEAFRVFAAGLFLAASVLFVSCAAAKESGTAKRPNFILILSDDQGWDGLSVPMHPEVAASKSPICETPNLERLAAQAMRFSNAYAPAPVCSPTRISIQTGKSPAQVHWTQAAPSVTAADGYPLVPPSQHRSIAPESVTIGNLLKSAGYGTAHYGKWHLSGGGPGNFGYDEHDGDTGNEDAAPFVDPNPVDIFGMSTRACQFMEKNVTAGRPFYIQLSYNALHYSENALKSTIEKYRAKMPNATERVITRAAIAENLDSGVGQVLAAVETLGIADQTYVIYMSDNGSGGGGKGARGGLSGGKGALAEGGIRVPFIIRGPGIPANSWCHVPIVGYDLLPTLCSLAGVEGALPAGLEGGNIAPLFADGSGEVSRPLPGLLFHFPHYQGSNTPQSAIRAGDFKLLKFYETGELQLYNLTTDISEQHNLTASMPEKTSELAALLESRLRAVGAGLPEKNPQYDPSKPPSGRASRIAGESGKAPRSGKSGNGGAGEKKGQGMKKQKPVQ